MTFSSVQLCPSVQLFQVPTLAILPFGATACDMFLVSNRMDLKESVKIALKRYDTGDLFSNLPTMPKASVLIPLFVRGQELQVLMTLRSPQVGAFTDML